MLLKRSLLQRLAFQDAGGLFDFGGAGDSGGGGGGLFDFFSSGDQSTGTSSQYSAPDALQTGPLSSGGGFDFMKLIPSLIPVASGLIGMFRGQGGATDKALKAQGKSTQPMAAAGNEALQAYRTGTLTPSQQASLDQYRKQANAKWQQYFANAGIPVSSAQADIENKVNLDTEAYKNQLLQQDFQNAFAATGMSTTNLTNLARQQALQDEAQRKQWEDFMAQLGKIGGDVFGGGGIFGGGGAGDQAPPGTIVD